MTIGLLQPIEITASNNTFTVTCGGMGPTTFNLTVGTQPSLLTILREIDDHFVVTFAGAVTPALSTDHLVEFHSDLALTVAFDDPALGQLLGFRANIPLTAGPCTVTATDTPERCWFPEFVTENRHRWRRDHERAYSGSQAHDGTLAGVEVGPEVYRQRLVFQDVRAVGALVEAQQDSYLWAGDTIYPDERRSWEMFFHSVRASVTVNDAAAACHGVYYLPDIGVYETDDPAVTPVVYPATMGTGGIRYELTTDPDTYKRIRCGSGGHEQVLATLRELAEEKRRRQASLPVVRLNYALQTANLEQLEQAVRSAPALGAASIYVQYLDYVEMEDRKGPLVEGLTVERLRASSGWMPR